MAKLTAAEKKWVKQMNVLLAQCPSTRIGFYTIGDSDIGLYDRTHQNAIDEDGSDLVGILLRNEWGFDEVLDFPNPVDGVCG